MSTEGTTLKPMSDLATHPSEWTGHGLLKRSYELRAGDDVFATLRWDSAIGTRASAEAAGAAWTFKRVGFIRTHVTVRAPGSDADLAVFHPDWLGNGTVELALGARWKWKCSGFWRHHFGFVTVGGEPLIEYQANSFKLPPGAKLVVSPQALALVELPLLVTLGWYVTVLTLDDAGGAAAAAAAG